MPPADPDAVLEVVGAFYDAACAPEFFPDALASTMRLVGADRGYCNITVGGMPSPTLASHNLGTPDQMRIYDQEFARQDIWKNAAVEHGIMGRATVCSELVPLDVLHRSSYYNDFLRTICDKLGFASGALVPIGRDAFLQLGLHRNTDQADFSRDEMNLLQPALPHIGRAMHLYRRWQEWQQMGPLAAALDRVPTAMAIVGPGQRVLFCNAAGTALLRHEDGIALRQDRLDVDDPAAANGLWHALAWALAAVGTTGDASLSVRVPRRRRRHPLLAAVYPLTAKSPFSDTAQRIALVVLIEPSIRPPAAPAGLPELFGLTEAESRLVGLIGQGCSLDMAAALLSISRNTARNHLSAIFDKTGVNRQVDLIALLRSLAVS